jgi:hypothetical protein
MAAQAAVTNRPLAAVAEGAVHIGRRYEPNPAVSVDASYSRYLELAGQLA